MKQALKLTQLNSRETRGKLRDTLISWIGLAGMACFKSQ